MGRLKTGTPARLDGRTIDWASLASSRATIRRSRSPSSTGPISDPQINCGITATTPRPTRSSRRTWRNRRSMAVALSGRGPRYCPSIEDKVVRFADRDSHQIFLEPEGLDDPTVYPNGISTSLGEATQDRFLRTIPGLERVEVLRLRLRHRIRLCRSARADRRPGGQAAAGPLSRRPDQWDDRLRGGGRPGPDGRDQRRARGGRGVGRSCWVATRPISA